MSTRRSPASSPAAPATRLLLATADQALADRVGALAAAAGLAVDRVTGPAGDGPPRLRDLRAGPAADPDVCVVVVGADLLDVPSVSPAPVGSSGRSGAAPGASVGTGTVAAQSVRRFPSPPLVVVALAAEQEVPTQVWRAALGLGADHVALLPEAEPWLLDRLLDLACAGPRAPVVAVLGGRGGAGASVLAVALAVVAAQRGARPVLVDLDPVGGGLDLLLAADEEPGLRWDDLRDVRGRTPTGALGAALPQAHGVRFLTWRRGPRGAGAAPVTALTARSVVASAAAEAGLVVVDLARTTDAVGRAVLALADRTLLVVPAEVRAAAAAGRVLTDVETAAADIRLVVRGPAPTGLSGAAIADALDLPLAADLRAEPGLAGDLDRGLTPPVRPRSPLAAACQALCTDLGVAGPGRAARRRAG